MLGKIYTFFFTGCDISRTGSRVEINKKMFRRTRFHAFNDHSSIDRKLLSSKLQRFKFFNKLHE